MKKVLFCFISLWLTLLLYNCHSPLPTLTSISPDSKVSHMPSFTLTAFGTDFGSDSRIVFNGIVKLTNYVSSKELTCEINSEEITTGAATIPVLVRNTSDSSGDSDTLNFIVTNNYTFNEPENLSNSPDGSYNPFLLVDVDGNLNVAWEDETPGNYEIYFSESSDDGLIWSQPINLSNTSGTSSRPAMAADGAGNRYVVWYDYTPGKADIFFIQSNDYGLTWSYPLNISRNPDRSYYPVISVDDAGDLYVVWYDDTPGKFDILFSHSSDNGTSWSSPINISKNNGDSKRPAMTMDSDGNLNISWEDNTSGNFEIYFSRSMDKGASWSPVVNISKNSSLSFKPAMAMDSVGNLSIIWEDNSNGDYEIYFSRSTDNGGSWSPALKISNYSTGYLKPKLTSDRLGNPNVSRPHIAIDNAENINVVWNNHLVENVDIYFRRSIDGGENWSPAINISNYQEESFNPSIAVNATGDLAIAWFNWYPGNTEIYYTGSTR